MTQRLTTQAFFLLLLSFFLGAARQWAPHGIPWTGVWPTDSTGAEEAYRMMAKAGDPPYVSLTEVVELEKGKKAILLDARAHNLFIQGHLPGARNLPFYELETYQDKALANTEESTPLIVYCEGVGCELSFFLGRELQQAGYKNIRIFYGGYPEWEKAGLPIDK